MRSTNTTRRSFSRTRVVLLEANRRERDEGESQAFYAGLNRPRELDHDAHLSAAYREEEARLRQEHGHLEVRRVVLEQDLKRKYQNFLQDHNRDRSDSVHTGGGGRSTPHPPLAEEFL